MISTRNGTENFGAQVAPASAVVARVRERVQAMNLPALLVQVNQLRAERLTATEPDAATLLARTNALAALNPESPTYVADAAALQVQIDALTATVGTFTAFTGGLATFADAIAAADSLTPA